MRLTREIRFHPGALTNGPSLNSWAGSPDSSRLDLFIVIRITVEGTPHPKTGYLCDIAVLDRLVREAALPLLGPQASACGAGASANAVSASPPVILTTLAAVLPGLLPEGIGFSRLEFDVSPYTRLACRAREFPMIRMTQSFEFSASHRLYCCQLGDEENRRIFGKCANPNGHGHNYVVEVTVAGEVDPSTGVLINMEAFQRFVRRSVIDRFDHKHLNLDCPEFAALNPSVENISRVIWDLLKEGVDGKRLAGVRVWETPKTCAEYDGP